MRIVIRDEEIVDLDEVYEEEQIIDLVDEYDEEIIDLDEEVD